jgi:hypothetical protein
MRQMANQEMKRSFRDSCGAASAFAGCSKNTHRRATMIQPARGLAGSNVTLEIVPMRGRAASGRGENRKQNHVVMR